MRAFVAIEVSDAVRTALAEAQRRLAGCPADVKWVAPEGIHLTLKFLGEIDEAMLGRVKAAMVEASIDGPFEFAVEGLGTFPARGKPRVIWAGVTAGAKETKRLQEKLDAALRPLGFEPERDQTPHVTIGRMRSPRGFRELMALVLHHSAMKFGTCAATEMVLFRSELTPHGAIYTALARQRLG